MLAVQNSLLVADCRDWDSHTNFSFLVRKRAAQHQIRSSPWGMLSRAALRESSSPGAPSSSTRSPVKAIAQAPSGAVSNIDGMSEFLLSINVGNIHLLDYHNMGETKIDVINGDQKKLGFNNYTIEAREQVEERLLSNGISVIA